MEDVPGELASGTIHFRMFPSCRLGSRLEVHQAVATKRGQNTSGSYCRAKIHADRLHRRRDIFPGHIEIKDKTFSKLNALPHSVWCAQITHIKL